MRFPFPLNPRADRFARGFALVALGAALAGLGGACADKHIGRPCQVDVPPADAGSAGGSATITSPALECPSRICILPNNQSEATADKDGAFCTYPCSTDDDCSDAETVSKSDVGDPHCKSNFICTWPTTSGPFCCQKMCICHDFLSVPAGGIPEPVDCKTAANGGPTVQTCANVH